MYLRPGVVRYATLRPDRLPALPGNYPIRNRRQYPYAMPGLLFGIRKTLVDAKREPAASFTATKESTVSVFAAAEVVTTPPVGRRAGKFATAAVLALSLLATVLAIWEAVSPFVPHAFFAVSFDDAGTVRRVYPAELGRGVKIAPGDRVLEHPNGNIERGYRLQVPRLGDAIQVATRNGVVTVRAQQEYVARAPAIGDALRHATGAVVILVAALLFLRRPGIMAFAFWIWAISDLGGPSANYGLTIFPPTIALVVTIVSWAAFTCSGLVLVSFALRFPNGGVPSGLQWLDVTAWAGLTSLFIVELIGLTRFFAGYRALLVPRDSLLAEVAMLGAAAILLWKRNRADKRERSRLAWASAAFVGAAIARAVALAVIAAFYFGILLDPLSVRLPLALSNLCLLMAIYPILHYRLFDIGFVINRATLYSTLTLAAFGTLAAVNWIAQHFVTDRLAFVLQPIAAVAIGLGYFRVRHFAQQIIERLLFRDRFAAEERLEATIRGLGFVERSASVDEVLVVEVRRTLGLASAALFRLTSECFERGLSIGWHDAALTAFPRDDSLARAVQANGPIISLRSVDWHPAALPLPPEEPVIALGILRRGALSAIALYGRHANDTEIEPEELALIGRLGAAAALAYEMAEVATLRQHNQMLQDRLQQLEAREVR
jgi:hypothetical protein